MKKTITMELANMSISISNSTGIMANIINLLRERQFDFHVGWFGVNKHLKSISVFGVKEKDVNSIQELLNEFVKTAAEITN